MSVNNVILQMAQILNLKFANINCHTFGKIYQIYLLPILLSMILYLYV